MINNTHPLKLSTTFSVKLCTIINNDDYKRKWEKKEKCSEVTLNLVGKTCKMRRKAGDITSFFQPKRTNEQRSGELERESYREMKRWKARDMRWKRENITEMRLRSESITEMRWKRES